MWGCLEWTMTRVNATMMALGEIETHSQYVPRNVEKSFLVTIVSKQ
jgi:hypothetical protein